MSLFAILREQVAIEHVLNTNGGGRAHCVAPEHDDTNPSMHLYEGYVHCFSCGFHGDVTDLWAALRGFDRPGEAALDLAREFDIELPEMIPEARQKAQQRRKKEDIYFSQTRACHRALERHPHMVAWWEGRGFGVELRKRFLLGTNRDGTAAVIPFWHHGRVQGLIRRKLEGEPKYLYPKAGEFPGGYRPLFIPASVRSGAFLTRVEELLRGSELRPDERRRIAEVFEIPEEELTTANMVEEDRVDVLLENLRRLIGGLPRGGQRRLAEYVQVHPTIISFWRTGRHNPSEEHLGALNRYFGLSGG